MHTILLISVRYIQTYAFFHRPYWFISCDTEELINNIVHVHYRTESRRQLGGFNYNFIILRDNRLRLQLCW